MVCRRGWVGPVTEGGRGVRAGPGRVGDPVEIGLGVVLSEEGCWEERTLDWEPADSLEEVEVGFEL